MSDAPSAPQEADKHAQAIAEMEAELEQSAFAPKPPPREPLKVEQKWSVALAIFLALLAPAFFAIAALGVKLGVWDWRFGLGVMTFQWAPIVIFAALGVSVIALVLNLIRAPRRGVLLALLALLVSGLTFGRFISTVQGVASLPPIHDIQTDWTRPIIVPAAIIAEREANGWNPILDDPVVPEAAGGRWPDAAGKRVADLQQEHYAYIKPLLVEAPPEIILEFAEGIAENQDWQVQSVDEATGLIHATSTSTWYGFTDDIFIRVTPQGTAGSRIDVRSVSRVGLSDMGANAKRIKSFRDDAHMAVRLIAESMEG